jgi:hypothetical protein
MMKNGFLFFIGLLAAFAFGWGGIALGSHKQLGALTPYYDDGERPCGPRPARLRRPRLRGLSHAASAPSGLRLR